MDGLDIAYVGHEQSTDFFVFFYVQQNDGCLFLFCFCDLYKYDLVLNIPSPLPCEEICFFVFLFFLFVSFKLHMF